MTAPSKQEIAVATAALRTEAGIWDEQGTKIGGIVAMAQALQLNRLQAGIFQIVVTAYGPLVDRVTDRCAEGQQRMSEISATLHQVADTYDAEEQKNVHRFRNLY